MVVICAVKEMCEAEEEGFVMAKAAKGTPVTGGQSKRKTTLSSAAPAEPVDRNAKWTFLTNHAHVLIVLESEAEIVLREVATRVGITERAVQRIVQDLEDEGYLRREKAGRQNRYEVIKGVPLRHPVESHCTIGQLLKMVDRRQAGR